MLCYELYLFPRLVGKLIKFGENTKTSVCALLVTAEVYLYVTFNKENEV